jgi:hypothetical protein
VAVISGTENCEHLSHLSSSKSAAAPNVNSP